MCIRDSVCPVYERTGGHAYGSVYPGPIGAILTPLLTGVEEAANGSLPYASSLCGACYDACPVKINIPEHLVRLRNQDVEAKEKKKPVKVPTTQLDAALSAASWLMSDGDRFGKAQKALPLANLVSPKTGVKALPGVAGKWTHTRTLPTPPKQSFRDWWKKERGDNA